MALDSYRYTTKIASLARVDHTPHNPSYGIEGATGWRCVEISYRVRVRRCCIHSRGWSPPGVFGVRLKKLIRLFIRSQTVARALAYHGLSCARSRLLQFTSRSHRRLSMENEGTSPARCTYDEWRLTMSLPWKVYTRYYGSHIWLSLRTGQVSLGSDVMIRSQHGLAGSGEWFTCVKPQRRGSIAAQVSATDEHMRDPIHAVCADILTIDLPGISLKRQQHQQTLCVESRSIAALTSAMTPARRYGRAAHHSSIRQLINYLDGNTIRAWIRT
ncbi:hypothetical protein V8C26DRAFT_53601 [Trichoderma gracile]